MGGGGLRYWEVERRKEVDEMRRRKKKSAGLAIPRWAKRDGERNMKKGRMGEVREGCELKLIDYAWLCFFDSRRMKWVVVNDEAFV